VIFQGGLVVIHVSRFTHHTFLTPGLSVSSPLRSRCRALSSLRTVLRFHHQPVRDHGHGQFLDLFRRDKFQPVKNASACAAFMSASDARGLAPSWTPLAVRVAETRSTT